MYDDIPALYQTSSYNLQYFAFQRDGTIASNNDEAIGLLQNKPKNAEDASLRHFGRSRARVGSSVSQGDTLEVTNSGWLVSAGSGGSYCAKALDDVGSGGIVDVICNFATASQFYAGVPTSDGSPTGEFEGATFTHFVDPSTDSISTDFTIRSTVTYTGSNDVLSGGYMSALGSVLKVDGTGTLDKIVGQESQLQITQVSSVASVLFFEAVPSILTSGSNVEQAVGYYMANVSGVNAIDAIQSLRFLQCDQADAPSLINGPIYAQYGYSMSGAGGELGPAPGFGYADNRYYWPYTMSGRATADGVVANLIYVAPFMVSEKWEPNRIGAEVSAAAGSGTAKLGIYNSRNGVPQGLVATASGTVDLTSATAQELTISATLYPGMYFLAINASATTTFVFGAMQYGSTLFGTETSNIVDGTAENTPYMSYTYDGSFPSAFVVTDYVNSTNSRLPSISLRKV